MFGMPGHRKFAWFMFVIPGPLKLWLKCLVCLVLLNFGYIMFYMLGPPKRMPGSHELWLKCLVYLVIIIFGYNV